MPVPAPGVPGPLLDCCGTGGGGLSIFNVSTAAMFVLAAGGVPVVKHGNRGVTKPSGSADVMEALGLRVELAPHEVGASLRDLGFAFLYAPLFHPAFRAVAPVRKALGAEGRRTVFNLLGPLLNPLRPEARLVGVFREEHVKLFAEALEAMGCPRFAVVHGTAEDRPIGEVGRENIASLSALLGEGLGLTRPAFLRRFDLPFLHRFQVGDAAASAALVEELLQPAEGWNEGHGLLIVNAGAGFFVQGRVDSVAEGERLAEELILGGAAFAKLRQARQWAQDHPGAGA